jgi:DNA-binding response OmpR family regulator
VPQRILIVDDDRELCSEISEILQDEGYLVDIARDGLEGEARIEEDYDIILLDFKMPGLNGVELLNKIKSKNKSSKIFLISGRPFLNKLISEFGPTHLVDAVFSKPFDVELLLAKIKELS